MHFNPFTFGAAGSLASANTNPLLGASAFDPRTFDALGALAAARASADGDAPARLAAGLFAPRAFGPMGGAAGDAVRARVLAPGLVAPHLGNLADRIAGQVFGPREWRFAQGAGLGTLGGAAALDIAGLASTDAAKDDYVPVYDTSATANRKLSVERLAGFARLAPGGRLTIASGDPVPSAGSFASTIYYTPYLHDIITLWDGTRWLACQFAELPLGLGTMTNAICYDIFAYLSAGAVALEKLAWSSATARATALTIQDGRYCKSTDKSRLYLGTIYSASTVLTVDLFSLRGVWNMYNRVRRPVYAQETTDSWTYGSNSWRALNNSVNNRLQFVRGLDEDAVRAVAYCSMNETTAGVNALVGIGLDSATVNSAQIVNGGRATHLPLSAEYIGLPGIGAHYLQALERVYNAATATFYGDAGVASAWQAGIVGEVWC